MRPVPRKYINAFIGVWLAVLAIDGFRPVNDAHQWLEDRIDYPLDLTGLWQGPWRLFAPEVDHLNLRLSAQITFADGQVAGWDSPEWTEISAAAKFVRSREINYFSNILTQGKEPAWDGLCAYLARTTPHPQGKPAKPVEVALILKGAIIPPVEEKQVPPGPYVEFDAPEVIYRWRVP